MKQTTETDIAAFNKAREELLKRVELRDKMVLAYIGLSMATLGGTMLSKIAIVGLLIPAFGFAVSLIVNQHTMAIHYICCWTRRAASFPHWGNSAELEELHGLAIRPRVVAHLAVFVIPSLVALVYAYPVAFAHADPFKSGLWWFGVVMMLVTTYSLIGAGRRIIEKNVKVGYSVQRPPGRPLGRAAHAPPRASILVPAVREQPTNGGADRKPLGPPGKSLDDGA